MIDIRRHLYTLIWCHDVSSFGVFDEQIIVSNMSPVNYIIFFLLRFVKIKTIELN